jgi:hypothetical protein
VGDRGAIEWCDSAWWQGLIDAAIGGPDPVISNLRITLAHEELSRALHEVTGEASGANLHTWAVWGSKKAGRTIRREDVPLLRHGGPAIARRLLGRAADHIFGGNVTVLDDIGRKTARFVSTFIEPRDRTKRRLNEFPKLSDRMNYIVDLFRSRPSDPNLFSPPFSAPQRDSILIGVRPAGPL